MPAIHIALTFDDNFWAPAYTVMRSICLSTRRKSDLVFHLLHMPLTPEHRQDLDKIATEFGAVLMYHALAELPQFDSLVAGLPEGGRWPKVVYGRLMLAELLPQDARRVIYLDCDTLVRSPIDELYDIDLLGMPLGAVRDSTAPFISLGRDMAQNGIIFDGADPYFNSGVLVVDLDRWRELDLPAALRQLGEQGVLSKLYFDQDILNLVFRGRWHPLPWRWNTIDADATHEALNPYILHFTKVGKPWGIMAGILRSTAYARFYRHVMTNELFYRFARHRWKRWWSRRLGLRRS